MIKKPNDNCQSWRVVPVKAKPFLANKDGKDRQGAYLNWVALHWLWHCGSESTWVSRAIGTSWCIKTRVITKTASDVSEQFLLILNEKIWQACPVAMQDLKVFLWNYLSAWARAIKHSKIWDRLFKTLSSQILQTGFSVVIYNYICILSRLVHTIE